jgi:tetratricopeptide (TPR) repeat protein
VEKICKKVFSFMVILFVFSSCVNIASSQSSDYVTDDRKRIPVPKAYVLKEIIYNIKNVEEGIASFKSPRDLFIDKQGFLFVADTGNNRVVKLNKNGEMMAVFTDANGKPFNSPQGLFVDTQGYLYITDTGNQRIVQLSDTGEFVREYIKPKSELLDENFTFDRAKLCVSPTDFIYVLKGENILIMDKNNNFRGYLGQTEIEFKLVDVLLRIFASEEQKRVIRKRTAATYINMTMDEKGMIYATTKDYRTGEIKKLNSIGKNIYKKYETSPEGIDLFELLFGFLTQMQVSGKSFVFGERTDDEGNWISPVFKDIAVDKNGIVTVIEEITGKIYQYDHEGNHLVTFGGVSDLKGHFSIPEAIDVDETGCIYILDRVLENIQVFEPTTFIKDIHQAVNLYADGEYDEAYNMWKKILKTHENYPLARLGLAKSLYKKKMWKESMEEYKQANDPDGYSKAFVKFRYEVLRNKFAIILLSLIIVAVILVLLLKLTHRLAEDGISYYNDNIKKSSIINQFKLSLGVIFHPVETFELIKNNRDSMSIISGVIGISEAGGSKNTGVDELRKKSVKSSRLRSYTGKEIKLLLRTPIYFLNCVITNFMMPVIFLILPIIQSSGSNDINIEMIRSMLANSRNEGIILAIVVAASVFIAGTNGITVTSISREGQQLYINKYLPMSYTEQLYAKVLSGVIFSTAGMAVLIAIATIILRIDLIIIILSFIAGFIAIFLTSLTGIIIDLYNPKLIWDTEQKAVKQNMNVLFNMLISMALAFLTVFGAVKLKTDLYTTFAILVLLFGLLDVILYKFLDYKGAELFSGIE